MEKANRRIMVAPSMLSADFGRLAEEARRVEAAGADMLHIDVMDGMFVPNISFGAVVVKALKAASTLPLDVHMMVQQPERYIGDMIAAGADSVSVHVEATPHIHRAIQQIREHPGVVAGVTLNPGTPAEMIAPVLGDVGLVLVMTVNPGFGGQKLIPSALEKVRTVRDMLDAIGSDALLEVDGGVTAENAREFTSRGATLLVSGTGVFGASDMKAAITAMKQG